MMELRPTTDWRALEEAVSAIARKASVGVSPEEHESYLWVRLGMRELTPLAIFEDGQRVGSVFYEVHSGPPGAGNSILHLTGWHMNGNAAPGWQKRALAAILPIAASLGCGKRVHFSSPRAGWARAVGGSIGFKSVSRSWLYDGEVAHG